MARKFGITGEVPSRHFPRWQILLTVVVAFALVSGGTIFGLSQTIWQSPTISIPPEQGGIVQPSPTETPTPQPTPTPTAAPLQKIEVRWGNIIRSPGAISGLAVEDEGNTIYTVEVTGPGKIIIRKSEDGGETWQEIEEAMAPQKPVFSSKWWGRAVYSRNEMVGIPDEVDAQLRYRLAKTYNLEVDASSHYAFVIDENHRDYVLGTFSNIGVHPTLIRVFLSLNNGQSWTEVSGPPPEGGSIVHDLAMISSDEEMKIYLTYGNNTIWQTALPVESLPD